MDYLSGNPNREVELIHAPGGGGVGGCGHNHLIQYSVSSGMF